MPALAEDAAEDSDEDLRVAPDGQGVASLEPGTTEAPYSHVRPMEPRSAGMGRAPADRRPGTARHLCWGRHILARASRRVGIGQRIPGPSCERRGHRDTAAGHQPADDDRRTRSAEPRGPDSQASRAPEVCGQRTRGAPDRCLRPLGHGSGACGHRACVAGSGNDRHRECVRAGGRRQRRPAVRGNRTRLEVSDCHRCRQPTTSCSRDCGAAGKAFCKPVGRDRPCLGHGATRCSAGDRHGGAGEPCRSTADRDATSGCAGRVRRSAGPAERSMGVDYPGGAGRGGDRGLRACDPARSEPIGAALGLGLS